MAETKTFTCPVCGNTVSRRKSVMTSTGQRVCRTHPDANKTLELLRERTLLPARSRSTSKNARSAEEEAKFKELIAECWLCRKKGAVALDLLKEMEAGKSPRIPEVVTHLVPAPENVLRKIAAQSLRSVGHAEGYIALCEKCAAENGIDFWAGIPKLKAAFDKARGPKELAE